jgi:serine/threonine-protein kinase
VTGATPQRLEDCRQRLALYEAGRPYRAELPKLRKNATAYQREGWDHVRARAWDKAFLAFQRALLVNTKCVEALNGMAWLWATCAEDCLRDGQKALEYARRCCDLMGWKNPYCLDTLAAACAECGQFDEAVKHQMKALELAPAERHKAYKAKVQLYRSGKPYRTAGDR